MVLISSSKNVYKCIKIRYKSSVLILFSNVFTEHIGNPIHHVYIADGFMDDAEELIQRCVQRQNILDFQSFCTVWKEMDIGCMYQGRSSGAEVAELSEEVLQIAKHYMLADTSNYEESVAGLFLVYSLLNLQPYPGFAALRLVPDDVPAITRLETVARKDRRHDVLYILASVLIKGSQYHAAEREMGMEAPIKKYLDGFRSIDSIRGVRPKGVFYRQNEELDIIRELGSLTNRYTEAKKAVIGSGPPDKSLQYIKEDLPLELHCSLRKIISGMYDEEDDVSDDEENSPKEDHAAIVESIKSRAMRETVNPMKHLMGIEDRKRQAKSQKQQNMKSDIKSYPGKVRTNSPTKPQTSPRKRKTSHKGNESKKSKSSTEASTSSVKTENKNSKEQEFQDEIFPEENQELCDDEEEVQAPNNIMNLEIGYLPSLIRTDDAGQIIQIELIDNGNPEQGTKVDVIELQSLPDLDNMESQSMESEGSSSNQPQIELKDSLATVREIDLTKDDNQTFRRQRNRKKTHLKSKFKRMGILPVANFHDPA